MNRTRFARVYGILLCAAAPAAADAPLIYAVGFASGGDGPRTFAYHVDAASYPMMEFRVGTNDLDVARYTNILVPENWHFAIEEAEPIVHACGLFTPAGHLSGGPCWGVAAGTARWWTDDPSHAVEHFVFGYDHPWRGEDLGWWLTCRRDSEPDEYRFFERWNSSVGTGLGPLHGPYEDPGYCWENDMCEEYEYCYFPDCGLESGMCVVRPWLCRDLYAAVCGCDGITYASACEAAVAGMSLAHDGPCRSCDLDLDGDVDIRDFLAFEQCMQGPGQPIPLPCAAADSDFDVDVDLADFRVCQGAYHLQRNPHIGSCSHEGCLDPGEDSDCAGDDTVEWRVEDGVLHTTHDNALYNCCLDDVIVTLDVDADTIRLTEEEILTQPCYCLCCYRVYSSVVDLAPGTYQLEYCWEERDTFGERCVMDSIVIP